MKIVNDDSGRLLNMDEASTFLGLKKSTLYQKVMRKEISHKKLGKLTRFSMQDIQEFINRNHVEVKND